jgi:hypothetical protein
VHRSIIHLNENHKLSLFYFIGPTEVTRSKANLTFSNFDWQKETRKIVVEEGKIFAFSMSEIYMRP